MKRIIAIWAVLVVLPQMAHAGDAQEEAAKDLFIQGTEQFANGEYTQAAESFREAYSQKPSYKIFYNLGQSEAAAKQYGLALVSFQKYLAEGGDEVETIRQDEVRQEIKRLRDLIGYLELKSDESIVAVFKVDNVVRGEYPTVRRIPVAATVVHELEFTIDGATTPIVKQIQVSGGDTVIIDLTNDVRPESTGTDDAPTETNDRSQTDTSQMDVKPMPKNTSRARKLWLTGLSLTIAGSAALIAGTVCGGLVLSKEKELDEQCEGLSCETDQKDLLNSRDKLVTGSTILWIGGGVITATGIALIVASRLSKKNKRNQVTVLPTAGGITILGRF